VDLFLRGAAASEKEGRAQAALATVGRGRR
jgi:hypothetical protein